MKRRTLLKIGCTAMLIPSSGYACIQESKWEGLLTITNLVPNSRIAVISDGDMYISDHVTGTEWCCYPPLNTDLRIIIRKAQEPPYYKSLSMDEIQVTGDGLQLYVQQQEDD